jgi:bacterioferritin-associated ferredoxin
MGFFNQKWLKKLMDRACLKSTSITICRSSPDNAQSSVIDVFFTNQLRIVLISVNIPCMIICVCNNVNETAIRRAVTQGHASYDALQFELGVGTCCGQCEHAAHEVLKQCHDTHARTHTVHTATPVFERLENALLPTLRTIRIQPV